MDWKKYLAEIQTPSAEFRAAPFYAWNAILAPEELRWQVNMLHKMGMGGYFMHARVGLGTKYLGKEWFECIKACIDESEKLGMKAYLYDEDRWPSGAAGGIVTQNPEYQAKCLAFGVPEEEALAVYAVTYEDKHLGSYRRIASSAEAKEEEEVWTFGCKNASKDPWYNGQTYLDTLSGDAVAEFIRVTHEKYAGEVGSKFGGTVPAIFTDEPAVNNNDGPFSWTAELPEMFRKKCGYDLLDHLPELVLCPAGEEFSKVRVDYTEVLTTLFTQNFMGQIGSWCAAHHLAFTGHVMEEDLPTWQTMSVGSVMRCYEHMQIPGIDSLTEWWDITITAKQCSSAAHQFGRTRRLTETYGCTGWDFPFFGHKAQADEQFLQGINLRVPHLTWYSMEGEAKRDYPASISYQSPWYRYYREIEDVMARTNAALVPGEEVRDLLMIHPVESVWGSRRGHGKWLEYARFYGETENPGRVYDQVLKAATDTLLNGHLDFDYGDEDIIARHGRIEKDSDGTPFFAVAQAKYRAVIIPRLATIRSTTLNLLQKFRAQGGTVVYLDQAPDRLDAVKSDVPEQVYRNFTAAVCENCVEILSPVCRRIQITAADKSSGPIRYLLKKNDDSYTLFLCNIAYEPEKYSVRSTTPVRNRKIEFPMADVAFFCAPENAKIYEYDPADGKLYAVDFQRKNDGVLTFRTSFAALESRLYFITAEKLDAFPPRRKMKVIQSIPLPEKDWTFELDEPNVVILDQMTFTADGKDYPSELILNVDAILRRDILGVEIRGGHMVQPWLTHDHAPPEKVIDLTLHARFNCTDIPKNCKLALERPELFEITLNGVPVAQKITGYWVDHSCKTLDLPDAFVAGENRLELRTRYHRYLPGLEAMFILGDFSVKDDNICLPVKKLNIGDVCPQGLPYYSGNIVYRNTLDFVKEPGRSYELKFNEWCGVSLAVRVNGGEWRAAPYPPFRAEITDELTDGSNTVELRVLGSRRNSHGPFYNGDGNTAWYGSWQFVWFDHEYRLLAPFGLLEVPEIEVM